MLCKSSLFHKTLFRIHKRTQLLLVFCVSAILSFSLIFWMMTRSQIVTTMCGSEEDTEFGVYDRCLDGMLHGCHYNGGIGNVVFELLAFFAQAEKNKRKPIITDWASLKRVRQVVEYFPALKSYVQRFDQATCSPCYTARIEASSSCCKYDQNFVSSLKQAVGSNIQATFFYSQSGTYFDHFETTFVKNVLLGATEEIVHYAINDLFPPSLNRTNTTNVCVHIRRGDFVDNSDSLPSYSNFTHAALRYILAKDEYRNSPVYVMTNDVRWAWSAIGTTPNLFLPKSDSSTPPNAEWEFSRLYCDTVLLTASVSTYGWWMGYLSRGQNVYYNSVYSTPNGIEDHLDPNEFWPTEWVALSYTSTGIVEVNKSL